MSWFYLALLSALTVALADAYTKKGFAGFPTMSILLIRFSVPGLLLLPLALFHGLPPVPAEFWYYLAACVPLELIAMWFYITAIRDYPLHLTLPFLAFTPVFNILTGYVVLGEQVELFGAIGILLVVVGTYILNIDSIGRPVRDVLAPFRAVLRVRGSLLMLLVAGIYSFTSVLSKRAMQFTTPESFGALYFVVLGLAVVCLALLWQPRAITGVWQRPRYTLLVAIFMAVMVVSHFLAIAMVEVAYMVAVKRTSLLFGILLGAWLFRAGRLRQHVPAAIIMLIGVVLILIG